MLRYLQTKLLKNIDFYLLLIIAAIVCWAYSPSLFHAPRADQIIYLNCVNHLNNFKSLVFDTYALNRSCSGDVILFRPILYFLLGFEQWMFGYQFQYWQLTGILLHLLVLFVFFALLRYQPESSLEGTKRLSSCVLAFGVTLLFGVQYISMEMVVWHHINGYLLFTFFLLAGLLFLRYYVSSQNYLFLSCSFLLVFLSAFTYELGSIAGVLIAIYLFNLHCRDKSINLFICLLFLLIPLAYIGVSFFDLYHRGYTTLPLPNFMGDGDAELGFNPIALQTALVNFFFKPLVYTAMYAIIWLSGGIIPSLYELKAGGRMRLAPQLPTFSLISIFLIVIVLSLIVTLFATRRIDGNKLKKESGYFCLLGLLLIFYIEIIIYGRTLVKGWQNVLANNLYYAYFFNILSFLLLYQCLIWCTYLRPLRRWGQSFLQFYFAFFISCSILISGAYIHSMNHKMIDFSRPILVLLERSLTTIQTHSTKPDFSFKIENECEDNTVLEWLNSSTLVEAVFPKYYNKENPKYILPCQE